MTTRIYDIDGTEKDAAWLAATYDGCEVLPARIPAGVTEYWRLTEVHCTTGNVVVAVSARRGNLPAVQQPVVMTYPTLAFPSTELQTLPASPNNWAPRGNVQRTNSNGLYEYELGSTYGPFYFAWVQSSAPSDCLSKTGMKGGTDHHGPLYGVWELSQTAPTYDTLEKALHGEAQAHQAIQFNPMAALQTRADADGFTINSPEFDVVFGGVTYRAQRAEHQASGVVRCYYCEVPIWTTVKFIEW